LTTFLPTVFTTFFIALGVLLGGSLLGSMGSFLFAHEPPIYTMFELAEKLKVWAIATAIGGAFTALRAIEIGFLSGQPAELLKHLALIISAFLGAQFGFVLLKICFGGE